MVLTLLSHVYQKLLVEAKSKLGEILSAFEFLDSKALDLVSFLWQILPFPFIGAYQASPLSLSLNSLIV